MTTGEFKQWLIDNEVPDDTPMWKPYRDQGGLLYPSHWGGDIDNVGLTTETFGLALPRERQKQETGVMLW
jgi:hypothetical protein